MRREGLAVLAVLAALDALVALVALVARAPQRYESAYESPCRHHQGRAIVVGLMRKGQGKPFRREALFGGTGEVLVWDLLGAARLRPFTAVLACELEAGGSVGTHVQRDFAEIIVFTEGEGLVTVGGQAGPVSEGSVVLLPLGKTLAIENRAADRPLRYLIIKATPEPSAG